MTLEKLNDSPPLNLTHSVKIKLGLNFVVGQDAGVWSTSLTGALNVYHTEQPCQRRLALTTAELTKQRVCGKPIVLCLIWLWGEGGEGEGGGVPVSREGIGSDPEFKMEKGRNMM